MTGFPEGFDPSRPLENGRHEKFAQILAVDDSNATDAYELAGFKRNDGNAARLKGDERIQARIAYLRAQKAERVVKQAAIDKAWIMTQLVHVYEQAMKGNPVLDRYGKPTGDFIANYSGANRALELLGKSEDIGMFVERKDVTTRSVKDIPTEELKAELAELKRELGTDATRH